MVVIVAAATVHHMERYRHRLSIDGAPLFYYLMAGRKRADIGARWLRAAD